MNNLYSRAPQKEFNFFFIMSVKIIQNASSKNYFHSIVMDKYGVSTKEGEFM
jgi:hypothetical protein